MTDKKKKCWRSLVANLLVSCTAAQKVVLPEGQRVCDRTGAERGVLARRTVTVSDCASDRRMLVSVTPGDVIFHV